MFACAYAYCTACLPHLHCRPDPRGLSQGSRAAMAAGTLPYLLPKQSEVTVCEVSCRLVHGDPKALDGAAHGLALPEVAVDETLITQQLRSRVPTVTVKGAHDGSSSSARSSSSSIPEPARSGAWAVVQAGGSWLQSWLLPSTVTPPYQQQLHAWHTTRPWMAVADPALGAVCVYDVDPPPGATTTTTTTTSSGSSGRQGLVTLSTPRATLLHELHRQVSSVAWRPLLSSMLAVGVEGGVALWSLTPSPLAGGSANSNSGSGSGAVSPAWVTFLPYKEAVSVTGLAWSPGGTHLAGSSSAANRLVVWDVALGLATHLRLSLAGNPLLSWSPDGSYLLAGGQQGYLYLVETTTWTHTAWQLPAAAHLLAAAWAPNSRVVLLALSGATSHLVALHLVAPPPSLTAQMLPVTLPELSLQQAASGSSSSRRGGEALGIASMGWDPSGQRLAVALTAGCDVTAGCRVALYSTSYDPVVHCSFLGFLRPFAAPPAKASSAPAAAAGSSSRDAAQQADQQGGKASLRGESPALSLRFACAPPGKAAAVLSVQQGLRVRSIPCYI